jgi:hypothetical protein
MPVTKPEAGLHLEKARLNFAHYEALKAESRYLDWAVTVLFYTAPHLVQAYLVESANTGFDIPRDHPERDNAVARLLPEIYTSYRLPSTRSQWARYHVDKPTPTPELLQQYEDHHFRRIETAMNERDFTLKP